VHDRAFLVILESMTPAERVSFLLHDVFEHPSADVAAIVGRTPQACRQLATSARLRIRRAQPIARADGRAGKAGAEFQAGVGHVTAALQPVEGGAQIAGRLIDLAGHPATVNLMERTVNGEPGPVAVHEGTTVGVYAFEVAEGRIQSIWIVLNPEKLRTWKGL
jgi:hypothetical protein